VSAPVPSPSLTYFEDVEVGSQHETPGLTVTEAHVGLYGGLTGDHASGPGLAPELLALCLSTGLGWRIERPPLVVLAFMSIDWKVDRPLHVGDTIRSRSRTALKRSMKDGGVVIEEHELVDQHGDVLQHGKFTFLVAKRAVLS
jgi:3-hydroxybutyryl-CoA dehydratase